MRFWGIIHLISFFQDRVEHWDSQIVHHHHTCCIRKFSQPAQNHIPPNQCFHRNKLRWVDNLAVFFEFHIKTQTQTLSHKLFSKRFCLPTAGLPFTTSDVSLEGFEIMDSYWVINSCWATLFCPSLDKKST